MQVWQMCGSVAAKGRKRAKFNQNPIKNTQKNEQKSIKTRISIQLLPSFSPQNAFF